MKRIFLDTAAGTEPNPASLHAEGRAANRSLEAARRAAAAEIFAQPDEIIFTSGGTEANNLAILGLPAGPLITSAIEHPSILAPAKERELNQCGRLLLLPVDEKGLIKLADLEKLLSPETVLVSLMHANSEIGTIQPIVAVAKIIRSQRRRFNLPTPYFHLDACQSARFLSLDTRRLGVDLMTIDAGKFYGPPGAGLLFVRRGLPLRPIIFGGGQESGQRAGTENVAAAVGLAAALTLANRLKTRESKRLTVLRDYFIRRLIATIPKTRLNGDPINRLPNNVNLSFAGVLGEQVVLELDAKGIAVSTGSACIVSKSTTSYVIMALQQNRMAARSAVRFAFGRQTTKQELNYILRILPAIISRLRKANHAYAADLAL